MRQTVTFKLKNIERWSICTESELLGAEARLAARAAMDGDGDAQVEEVGALWVPRNSAAMCRDPGDMTNTWLVYGYVTAKISMSIVRMIWLHVARSHMIA